MVPPSDPESNFGIAWKLLFSQISIPEGNIHRIKGENNPESEALSYSKQIQASLIFHNGWPVFDLILLGMGDDGHTASIFPNQMELLASDQICAIAIHPESGQKRVTLTGKTINNALKVCFLVTGVSKATRISEVFSNPGKAFFLPANHIQPGSGDLAWYADESAANLL
jgi:6-phosphogluconolactonase